MVNKQSLTVSLEEFGLSKYESQIYITLISRGTASASELAYYSDLPRTKVYPTLLKLEKKKLAIVSKGKPITGTAIAPEDAFDSIIHEQINKVNAMNSLVSNLKKASDESRKIRGSEEKRYFELKSNRVLAQLRRMIDGTKSTISMIADQWGLGLLAECREQLLSAVRKELEVKLIVHPSQVCTKSFQSIPDGVNIRTSDMIHNCFIFDGIELLLVDSRNGNGTTFSSTDILVAGQAEMFSHIWNNATDTEPLTDMTLPEAQDIYKIIKAVNEYGLPHILSLMRTLKKPKADMLGLLEKNGINLSTRSPDDVIDMIDAAMRTARLGHAIFDAKDRSITIESDANSGHLLPWASILEECMQRRGYDTRTILQSRAPKGERIFIKISQ